MRWPLGFVALIACRDPAPPPAPPPPNPARVPAVAVDAAAPPDVAVTEVPVRSGPPLASLVVTAKASKRIVVTPRGPVTIDGAPVELADLGPKLPKGRDVWTTPGASGSPREELRDGKLWVRTASLVNRPVLVADGGVQAIRLFEVARAAQPVGAALEVVDPSGASRAFGFRVTDAGDRDAEQIDDPIEIEIDYAGITIRERTLPLTATPAELAAAIAASREGVAPPATLWGFLTLSGSKLSLSTAITAMDAMGTAGVVGISIIAGAMGASHLEIAAKDPIARRYLRRRRTQLGFCYDQWLASHPDTEGRIELVFGVGADKIARVARATQTGVADWVASCFATMLVGTEIPGQPGSTLVVPILLEPDGG